MSSDFFMASNGQPGDEAAAVKIEDIDSWQFAWARLIAKAWEDDNLANALTESTDVVKDELEKLGYKLPGKLVVKVEKAEGEWIKDLEVDGTKVNGYANMLNELTGMVVMKLPPKPADVRDNAYALADYNASGKDYPFSL